MNAINGSPYYPVIKVEHNTAGPLHGACCTGTPYFGEVSNVLTGVIDSYQSNLQWNTIADSSSSYTWPSYAWTTDPARLATLAVDPIPPASITNNACGGCRTVPPGTWATAGRDQANGTIYNLPLSATPGANDLPTSEMPQFVDSKRSFRAWADHAQGLAFGSSTIDSTVAYITSDLTMQGAKIADLVSWTMAGFAPTNEAYRGAGHDGLDIGAVPMAALPPATSSYRPIQKKVIAPSTPPKYYQGIWRNEIYSQTTADGVIAQAKVMKANVVYAQFTPDRQVTYRECTGANPISASLNPGFDSLSYMISASRGAGVELGVWIPANYFVFESDDTFGSSHVWTLHGPGTAEPWYSLRSDGLDPTSLPAFDSRGLIMLDPGVPEVLNYTAKYATDFLACYSPDILQIDYIRYPISGSNNTTQWGYHPTTVARYNRIFGLTGTPAGNNTSAALGQWGDFRREQVYNQMRKIFYLAKEKRPSIKVAASPIVAGNYSGEGMPDGEDFSATDPYRAFFADWHSFLANKIVDKVSPFIYRNEACMHCSGGVPTGYDASARVRFQQWLDWMGAETHTHNRIIAPGLGYYLNTRHNSVVQAKRTLAAGTDGYIGFRFSCAESGVCDTNNSGAYQTLGSSFPETPALPDFPWIQHPSEGFLMGDVIVSSGPSYLNDRCSVAVKDYGTGSTVQTVLTDATGFWGATLASGTYKAEITCTGTSGYTSPAIEIHAGVPMRHDATVAP